jgi:hypothetical protein
MMATYTSAARTALRQTSLGWGVSGGEVGHVGDRVTGPRHRPLGRIHKGPTAGQPAQL